ncbi:MAG TPA: SMP-30/gluconolactonase/LRE family protein [Pyrinomonadaceae bacterium]|nr:SMP-30/gluconolactonase/LRE family protein [Pyrinomonadaceae bacterium]
MKLRVLFFILAVLPVVCLGAVDGAAQVLGDSNVKASVPFPGFPEGIAVQGNRFYVSGPAALGFPPGSAYVQAYDIATGAPTAFYPITISNPFAGISAAVCAAFGPDGKLYVIEPFVGVIRMELDAANTQSVYASFPPSASSLLNDLTFDGAGNLYVTDSFAATIYRVPAGGGTPSVWFTNPALVGHPSVGVGVNGIRIDKNNKFVYFSVTVNTDFNGVIYRLPLVANPAAADLQLFASLGVTGPDGIAFGKSGKLYIAEALSSTIKVLRTDGTVEAVYSGPALNLPSASVPWANPANIAFDRGGRLLVTNHAQLVPYNPSLFVIFDVYVNDKGQPLP